MNKNYRMFVLALIFISIPAYSAQQAKKPKDKLAIAMLEPTPKEQVVSIRRIATQSLDDMSQRLSTEDIVKLAQYKDDPDTTKEILISIIKDRIGGIRVMYADELERLDYDFAEKVIELKTHILKRGIDRLNNWDPSWTSEQIEEMILARRDNIITARTAR